MLKKFSLITMTVFLLSTFLVVVAGAAAPTGLGYNYSTGAFTGTGTGLVYSTDDGKTWKSASGTVYGIAGKTFSFRSATDTDPTNKSNWWTFTVASSTGAPGLSYSNGKITGFDASKTYQYNTVSATNTTWSTFTGGTELTVTVKQTAQTYYIRVAATAGAPASGVTTITVPAGAVSDTSSIKRDYINEQFTGFGTGGGGWYYTTVSATYTGDYLYAITGNTMTMYPDSTYYFRKSGDAAGSAFKTPERPAAPSGISYDAVTQKLTGVNTTLKYRIQDGVTTTDWEDIASETSIPQTDKQQTVYVAKKATETNFASHNAVVKIWAKPGVDDRFNPVRYDGGKVVGVTEEMEYQIVSADDNGDFPEANVEGDWLACKDGVIPIVRSEKNKKVYIRLKSETTKVISVEVPFMLPVPDVTFDIINGVVTGLNPSLTYVYSTNGTSWKDISNTLLSTDKTTFIVTSLLKGSDMKIYVAQKPSAGKPESDSATYTSIAKAPIKPTLTLGGYTADDDEQGYAIAKITNAAGIQFKLENDPSWSETLEGGTEIKLPVGYTASTYVFRFAPKAAEGDNPVVQASAEFKFKVAAPAKPPTAKVDYKKEQITIKAGMSYCLDGVTWVPASSSATTLKLIDREKGINLYGGEIMLRMGATPKKPASYVGTVKIKPSLDTPPSDTDVFIATVKNKPTVIMRSGTRQVEYKDGDKWKKGVPRYSTSLNVEIRFMGTDNFGPSESVTLTNDGIVQ